MLRKPAIRIGLLVAIVVGSTSLAVWIAPMGPSSGLVSFQSYAELATFLDRPDAQDYLRGGIADGGLVLEGPGTGVPGFTPTNVQVEGIDEPDLVKTDGTYLYLAVGTEGWSVSTGEVVVVRAVPPSAMGVVARLDVAGALPSGTVSSLSIPGLFVDGSRLIVLASLYESDPARDVWYTSTSTAILVYDLPIDASSAPVRIVKMSGAYVSARLMASHVYVIANEYAAKEEDVYRLPAVCAGGTCEGLPAQRIYYDPSSLDGSAFTTILALRLTDGATEAISVVTGYASIVYMSHESLYLTFFKWEELAGPFLTRSPSSEWTTIHKIRVEGLVLLVGDTADVQGRVLNQFGLDEHGGYLRVATTVWSWAEDERPRLSSSVYVLGDRLEVVGRLEGLAPGESVYSSRFLGDRGFLVTFEKIDPFFVLDLSVPTAPSVLGTLKVSGYSDYLHVLDERHVIGLGKETIPDASGAFSWYQGLKMSLFDVTDVREPREIARLIIGDRGTESEALRDHHAFTFLADQGLIAIPVDLAVIDAGVPEPREPWSYGTQVWQGAYVISVTAEDGFGLVGRITHASGAEPYDSWSDGSSRVRRSVHIGDYLYTISASTVKAHLPPELVEAGSLVYGLEAVRAPA